MNLLVKLTWMLLAAAQVRSGIIPDGSLKQETKTYTQHSSYLPVSQSNQNYNTGNQQQGNGDVYGSPTLQNAPNNAEESAAAFQQSSVNQQHQSLANTQQAYAANPFSGKQVQDQQVAYQSQFNANLNTASNPPINNQPSSYAGILPAQQVQSAAVQNTQANYEQNTYNSQTSTSSREAYSGYQKTGMQPNDQAVTERSRRIHPYPTLDLSDVKSKSSRKIPLVLITIQKNKNPFNTDKSKTNIKKQSSDTVKTGHESQTINGNIPYSSEKIFSKPALNVETLGKSVVNNYERDSGEVQNNAQVYSGNEQQQHHSQVQLPSSPSQTSQGALNQRYNNQLTPYRYPILAGKKMESSEWKPVDKYGIRVPDDTNSGFPQAYNQAYASNSNSQQTSQENYNMNSRDQQYKQSEPSGSPSAPTVDSNQNKAGKLDYQVTATYVHQADINFEGSSDYSRAPAINDKPNAGSQNYFVSNNIQGFKDDRSQQNREDKAPVSATQSQTNFRNDQFSVQGARSTIFDEKPQDQRQANFYQTNGNKSTFFYGVTDKHGQTFAVGNTSPFRTHSNANSNYNQVAGNVNKFASNYLPALQVNVNQNTASQTSPNTNLGTKNNQLHFSSNAQSYFEQNIPSQQTTVNNVQSSAAVSKSADKVEQEAHVPNSFKTLESTSGRFSISQSPVSASVEQGKSIGISHVSNYGLNQQHSDQNTANSYQQTIENFSGNERNQQNTYSTLSSISSQQNVPTRESYYQTSAKVAGQITPNNATPYQKTSHDFGNNQRNTQNAYDSISINNQQNIPTQENYFRSSVKTGSQMNQNNQNYRQSLQNTQPDFQNYRQSQIQNTQPDIQNYRQSQIQNTQSDVKDYRQSQIQSTQPDAKNYGYVLNQEKQRNNIFQSIPKFVASNNRQNKISPSEYHSGNVGFNTPHNKDLQASVNAYSSVNKDINTNYNNALSQGTNTFQGNNYGRNLSSATNIQSKQQNVFDSRSNPKPNNYEKNPASNIESLRNNYPSTIYGSSESQDSVVGAKPDKISIDQAVSNEQLYTATNYQQSKENKHKHFNEDANDEATRKEANKEEDPDSAPEALLLVLVSAKKSAVEDHERGETDDMDEGYESAPEELVELLNDETNRKMLMESVQEATDKAYKEQEKIQDEHSKGKLEVNEENERY